MGFRILCALAVIFLPLVASGQGTAAFQTRQTWTFGEDGVSFTNNFSGARLNGVTRTAENTYTLSITPERTPINDSPWYAFRVWATSLRTITLTLSYTGGHHRYTPKTSVDGGETWTYLSSSNVTVSSDEREATFQMYASSTVRIAAAQPLITLEEQMAWTANLASLPFVTYSTIGNSIQGRPIPRLEANTAPAEDSKTLILMTGQHPAEVTGVKGFRTFVETVLADTPLAREFRRRYNIVMFPLMNPDGWYHGHWRGNANGVDMNHYWAGSGNSICPETTLGLAAVRSIPNPAAFIDFHSTGSNIFYTGTDYAEQPAYLVPEFLAELAARVPDWPWGRGINESGEGSSSRSWVATEIGCASMTWEYSDVASAARLAQSPVEGANAMMTLLLKLWSPNKEMPETRYDFENAANLGTDSAGTRTASPVGQVAVTSPGAVGNAGISLAATGSQVTIPDFDYAAAGATISLWFKMDANSLSTGSFGYLFSHGTSLSANNLNIYHRKTSNQLRVRIQDANDGVSDIDMSDSAFLGDGKWHHLAITIVPGTGTTVHLDGVFQGSTTNGADVLNPTGLIRLGNLGTDAANQYRGMLDDVRIYQRVLTPYQLTAVRHRNAPAEPYLDWKELAFGSLSWSYLNPAAADDADPDSDGISNLMENALGGNPLAPDAAALSPRMARDPDTGEWVFEYRRRRQGTGSAAAGWTASSVRYRTFTSTDMLDWKTGTSVLAPHANPVSVDSDFETATLKSSSPGDPARFFKLEATRVGN